MLKTKHEIQIDVPDGISGNWIIDTVEVTKDESDRERLHAIFNGYYRYVREGTYKRLRRGKRNEAGELFGLETIMSNTYDEIKDHLEFSELAYGDVFIGGLGLGVLLKMILEKDSIKSITVVEKSKDVLALVAPHYKDPRLRIIEGDVFEYEPDKKFDCLWFDIWDAICSDNYEQMKLLNKKYRKFRNKGGVMDSWCFYICKRGYTKYKREEREQKQIYGFINNLRENVSVGIQNPLP